jgi:hypothetical protein
MRTFLQYHSGNRASVHYVQNCGFFELPYLEVPTRDFSRSHNAKKVSFGYSVEKKLPGHFYEYQATRQ